MSKKAIIISLITILAAGGLLLSGFKNRSPEKQLEHLSKHITKKLDLNEEQQAQLENSTAGLLEKKRQLLADQSIKESIIAELRSNSFDEQRLNEVLTQQIDSAQDVITSAVSDLAEFHRSLNPEQRERFVALVEKTGKRHSKQHRF